MGVARCWIQQTPKRSPENDTFNFLQNSDSEADTAGLEQENVCSIVLLGTMQALVASMGQFQWGGR